MSRNYQMMDKLETRGKVSTFFFIVEGKYLRDALKYFANHEGYGEEVLWILFQDDLDESEVENLPEVLDDKHVLVEFDDIDSNNSQIGYLDFPTFYKYMKEEVKDLVKQRRENADLLDLLAKVKEGLGL